MSGRIPSRKERLRRAHESSARTKNQWDNASDVYDDVRDVINTEDPQMKDYQLPEAVERRSAETLNLEEEEKAWQEEVKRFRERNMRYEQEAEKLGDEMQTSQLTDEEPDEVVQDRLRQLNRLVDGYPKLAVLLFQDEALFQHAIQNVKRSGNQLLSKLHSLLTEVNQIRFDIQEVYKEYDGRLNQLVKPLQNELADMQDRLEASEKLQSTTDTELTKVRENLQDITEQYQDSEEALQDEINKGNAEINELKKNAAMASRQITSDQTELKKLESEKTLIADELRTVEKRREAQEKANSTTMQYLSTEVVSVISQNARQETYIKALQESCSQHTVQHNAEIRAMITEKDTLSGRNDEQEANIEVLQETLKEIEKTLSQQINELQVENQILNSEKDALSTQIHDLEVAKGDLTSQRTQCQAEILALKAEKAVLTSQKAEFQTDILTLEAERDDLADCNGEYQDQIEYLNAEKGLLTSDAAQYEAQVRALEVENGDLTGRNKENESQIQALIQAHQDDSERLETAKNKMNDQINDLQQAVRSMQLDKDDYASRIEVLTTENQQLVTEAEDQSHREQQNLQDIEKLKVELETSDETLQSALNAADEERRSYVQENRQLQRLVFSNMLSLRGDKDGSLPAAGIRLFFKQEGRPTSQDISAFRIEEPLGDTLDQLTNSTEITASLVRTYQLALQGLGYLHTSSDVPKSLLRRLMNCRKWVTMACKDQTSILGLALDFTIKTVEQGPQAEPWLSINQFDGSRMIDSRNSDLAEGTYIIADGFSGVVLVVRDIDVHVLEATDVLIKQQEYSGFQLAFTGGLDLPALQLLPNSWPGYSRWGFLCSWALDVGRVNLVMKDGKIYEPPAL